MTTSTPSRPSRDVMILGVLTMTVGLGWLLAEQGFWPNINWVWTLLLAILGIMTFVMSGGVDKVSIVIGSFLMIGSVCSVFRQTGRLQLNLEVPLLVIIFGGLLMVSQLSIIPNPKWMELPKEPRKPNSH